MSHYCSYCGDRDDCVLVEMISWLCPKCFVKFYEYWTSRSTDFLHLYLSFKLQETYKTAIDTFSSVGEQIERSKIMAIDTGISAWLRTQKPLSFEHKY